MTPITLEQYAGPYLHSVDLTLERRSNAIDLLAAVNACLAMAEADGVEIHVNPATGCHVGGNGHGGFRDQACTIGAPLSSHKVGRAVDVYDPHRELASWSLRNMERLQAAGLNGMENPQWTPTWCHWQTTLARSGRFVFIPDGSRPLAAALPEQIGALG